MTLTYREEAETKKDKSRGDPRVNGSPCSLSTCSLPLVSCLHAHPIPRLCLGPQTAHDYVASCAVNSTVSLLKLSHLGVG